MDTRIGLPNEHLAKGMPENIKSAFEMAERIGFDKNILHKII